MFDNQFWKMTEIREQDKVFETEVYLVVVTPTLWRHLARTDDRTLGEFSIVNKLYGTVESSALNLPLAITTAKTLQAAVDDLTKKEYTNEQNVVPLR